MKCAIQLVCDKNIQVKLNNVREFLKEIDRWSNRIKEEQGDESNA